MTIDLSALTLEQSRAIHSNFSRSGPFFVSDDIHPMLDCATTWDIGVSTGNVAGTTVPQGEIGVSGPGVLREEFFGGLCYNRSVHRQAMVGPLGFEILRGLVSGEVRTASGVVTALAGTHGTSAVEQTLQDLWSAGVIAQGASGNKVRLIAAHDLSKPYYQAPTIVEAELTYGCFRACRHCAYSATPQSRTDDELTAEQWNEVFCKLADAGVFVIQLTGGDPLFRPDSFDISRLPTGPG